MLLQRTLLTLLGTVAVQGLVARNGEETWGEKIPNHEGFDRMYRVTKDLGGASVLRSSAPNYDGFDEPQTVTDQVIDTLRGQDVENVISLNEYADDPFVARDLQDRGIGYTPLAVSDFTAPELWQLEAGWRSFSANPSRSIIWCGFGQGRTGTMVTALQMHALAEQGQSPAWTRERHSRLQQYRRNGVETDDQIAVLELLHENLFHGMEGPPPPLTEAQATELVTTGSVGGVDCSAALAAVLAAFLSNTKNKRALPSERHRAVTSDVTLLNKRDSGVTDCQHAQTILLGQQCGVSNASHPSSIWLGSRDQGIRVYSRNAAGQLMEKSWTDGSRWRDWESLGGDIVGEPSAIWLGDGVGLGGIRVYARNRAGNLVEKGYWGGEWHEWRNLGGDIAGSPSVSRGGNGIRVYARNAAGELMEKPWEGGAWGDWRNLGGDIIGDPSAILLEDGVGLGGIRVYARNRAGNLMEKGYWRGEWHEWRNLGGDIAGSPSASRGDHGILVYAQNTAGELIEKHWEGGAWGDWLNLGGDIIGAPSAIYMGSGSEDNLGLRVYARNAAGELMEKGYSGDQWLDWISLGRRNC